MHKFTQRQDAEKRSGKYVGCHVALVDTMRERSRRKRRGDQTNHGAQPSVSSVTDGYIWAHPLPFSTTCGIYSTKRCGLAGDPTQPWT